MGVLKAKVNGEWVVLNKTAAVAGADRQVQYVAGAPAYAASQIEIAADGSLQLVAQTALPARPQNINGVTDRVKIVNVTIGNSSFPFIMHAGGKLRPLIFGPMGNWANWHINTTSLSSYGGMILSSTGTVTATTPAPGTVVTKSKRIVFTAAASAAAVVGTRVGTPHSAPGGVGSMLAMFTFGIERGIPLPSHRLFVGFRDQNTAPTAVDPSTLMNMFGIGYDAADANFQFFNNDSTGVATKTNLGAAWPKPALNNDTMYELILYQPWTLQEINWLLINLNTGAAATGTVNADLPTTAAVPMFLTMYASVGGVNSMIGIAIGNLEVWSPQ